MHARTSSSARSRAFSWDRLAAWAAAAALLIAATYRSACSIAFAPPLKAKPWRGSLDAPGSSGAILIPASLSNACIQVAFREKKPHYYVSGNACSICAVLKTSYIQDIGLFATQEHMHACMHAGHKAATAVALCTWEAISTPQGDLVEIAPLTELEKGPHALSLMDSSNAVPSFQRLYPAQSASEPGSCRCHLSCMWNRPITGCNNLVLLVISSRAHIPEQAATSPAERHTSAPTDHYATSLHRGLHHR